MGSTLSQGVDIRAWVSSSGASHKWKQISLIHKRSHSIVHSCASACRLGQLYYHVVPWSSSCCKEMPTKSLSRWASAWAPPALLSMNEGLALRVLRPPKSHFSSPSSSRPLVNPFPFLFFWVEEWSSNEWWQATVFREAEDLQVLGPLSWLLHPTDPLPLSEEHLLWSQILPSPRSSYLLNFWVSVFLFCKMGAHSEDVMTSALWDILYVLRQQMSLPRRWILPLAWSHQGQFSRQGKVMLADGNIQRKTKSVGWSR